MQNHGIVFAASAQDIKELVSGLWQNDAAIKINRTLTKEFDREFAAASPAVRALVCLTA